MDNLSINVPDMPYMREIFKILRSSGFISEDCVSSLVKNYYSVIKENYEAYFKNWGRIWCMKGRPEYLKLLLSVDVHSPVVLRANMQPRNFAEWYKTFDVKETDKMYIAPEKRICIW